MIVVLSAFITGFFRVSPAGANSPFYAEVLRVNTEQKQIKVSLMGSDRRKTVKYNDETLFYKKTRPQQQDFKAKPRDFKKGDTILVFSKNPVSPTPTAYEIWERRALLYKNGMIQTEVNLAGEITRADPGRRQYTITTFDQEKKRIKLGPSSRVIIDNRPGHPSDIRRGSKVYVVCRWKGFKEDEPGILQVYELLDNISYVIRKFREKFGVVLARGRVSGVNSSSKLIKVGGESGQAWSVHYDRKTRWIPATPRIKKPADFSGHRVIIFGEASGDGPRVARMVLNQIGVSSIFEVIARQGEIPGTVTLLAFGKLLSMNDNTMTIMHRGKKVKCRISRRTVFIKKGRRVSRESIQINDQVLVKGIYGRTSLALVVISFGRKD